jgi:assimilatory nitrate reductase catalytic subunit
MSRTGLLGRLYGHEGLPAIDLAPADLARLGLRDGDLVRVASRRGAIVLPARASEGLLAGQAFLPMHWGQEVLSGQDDQGQPLTGVNALTTPAFCPTSKQPELKHAAVAIEPVTCPGASRPWPGCRPSRPWRCASSCGRCWRPSAGPACCPSAASPTPRAGWAWCCAAPPPRRWTGPGWPRPAPCWAWTARRCCATRTRRPQDRALRVQRDADGRTQLQAFWLAGDTGGEAWLRQLLEADTPLPGPAHLLLAPGELARALVGEAAAPASPRSAPASMCGRTPSARPWRAAPAAPRSAWPR